MLSVRHIAKQLLLKSNLPAATRLMHHSTVPSSSQRKEITPTSDYLPILSRTYGQWNIHLLNNKNKGEFLRFPEAPAEWTLHFRKTPHNISLRCEESDGSDVFLYFDLDRNRPFYKRHADDTAHYLDWHLPNISVKDFEKEGACTDQAMRALIYHQILKREQAFENVQSRKQKKVFALCALGGIAAFFALKQKQPLSDIQTQKDLKPGYSYRPI